VDPVLESSVGIDDCNTAVSLKFGMPPVMFESFFDKLRFGMIISVVVTLISVETPPPYILQ